MSPVRFAPMRSPFASGSFGLDTAATLRKPPASLFIQSAYTEINVGPVTFIRYVSISGSSWPSLSASSNGLILPWTTKCSPTGFSVIEPAGPFESSPNRPSPFGSAASSTSAVTCPGSTQWVPTSTVPSWQSFGSITQVPVEESSLVPSEQVVVPSGVQTPSTACVPGPHSSELSPQPIGNISAAIRAKQNFIRLPYHVLICGLNSADVLSFDLSWSVRRSSHCSRSRAVSRPINPRKSLHLQTKACLLRTPGWSRTTSCPPGRRSPRATRS